MLLGSGPRAAVQPSAARNYRSRRTSSTPFVGEVGAVKQQPEAVRAPVDGASEPAAVVAALLSLARLRVRDDDPRHASLLRTARALADAGRFAPSDAVQALSCLVRLSRPPPWTASSTSISTSRCANPI